MAEEYEARFTADDKLTPAANKAADAVDEIPDEKTTKLDADASGVTDAKRDLDAVLDLVDKLGSSSARLVLQDNAKDIQGNIADLLLQLDRLDANDPQVTIKIDQINELEGQLGKIESKADELGNREIDIKTGSAKRGLDDIVTGADQANSAVANMVGNSAQDLGELAGVTGSAGVAVGQLAEYFTDSAFAAKGAGQGFGALFKSFAGAVGPIAAISAAVYGITTVISAYKDQAANAAEIEAFNVENAEIFKDAGNDILDIIDAYINKARDTGSIEVAPNADQQTEALKRIATEGENVADTIQRMKKAGEDFEFRTNDEGVVKLRDQLLAAEVTAKDFYKAADPRSGNGELDAFIAKVKASGASLHDQVQIIAGVLYQQEQYRTGAQQAADDTALFGEETEESAKSLTKQGKAATTAATGIDTAAAAAAKAADDFIKLAQAQGELDGLAGTFEQIGTRATALQDIFDLGSAPVEAAADVRDIAIAIDELSETAKDVNVLDVIAGNAKADKLLDAIDGLRPEIQSRLTEAFSTGGPEAATAMANSYIDQVTTELGGKLSREDVARLLGLSDIEATVKAAVDRTALENVKRELDILVGVGGETPYTAAIKLALDAGTITPEQATVLVQAALGDAGVTVPSTLAVPVTEQAVAEANAALAQTPITMPTTANTDGIASAVEDAARAVEGTEATLPVGADVGQAETDIAGAKKTADSTKGELTVSAQTRDAVNTILYVALVASLLKPVINVTANASSADTAINNAARGRTATLSVETSGVAAATTALNNLTLPRSVTIRPVVSPTSVLVRVDGG